MIPIQPQWDFKYIPRRICMPIGMACNVDCKYCMRLAGKVKGNVCKLNDMMRAYLKQLNHETTEAIVINGGEPLLYKKQIREVFDLIDPRIHKVVMTNGKLLDEEFVNYLNGIDGELHFSHEGLGAEYLKGIDVLKDPYIVKCLNKVKTMRIYNILTSKNDDLIGNYRYIMGKITDVPNLWYSTFPMFSITENEYLMEGFDYEKYTRDLYEFYENGYGNQCENPYHLQFNHHRALGTNVMPDGSIRSIADLRVYGSVLDSKEEITKRIREMGEYEFCENFDCSPLARAHCTNAPQCANELVCKCTNIADFVKESISKSNSQRSAWKTI